MSAFALFDNVEILDAAGLARYAEAVAPVVAAYGGRYRSAAPTPEVVEGEPSMTAPVLIEFPDLASAWAWYDSDAYRPLRALRQRSACNTAIFFPGT